MMVESCLRLRRDLARPAALIVATCTLEEIQVTCVVRFCGLPMPVRLPVAMNCVVSPHKGLSRGRWAGRDRPANLNQFDP